MYNVNYLFDKGGGLDDIYKPAVRELYAKLHDRLYPWRIFRLVAERDKKEQTIIITLGPNLRFRAIKYNLSKTFEITYHTGPGYRENYPLSASWDCSQIESVGVIVEDIITMVHWYEPKYTEFMQIYKKDKSREELMEKISIEVDYHPDSPSIELLKEHFDEHKT